jgi:putative membrane protein
MALNREELSLIRTHLANERTALSYVRTALAFMAAGAALIHFYATRPAEAAGWCFVAMGLAALAGGIGRYFSVRRRIAGPRD